MFADYRVPQALCAFGLLRYSENLQKVLRRGDVLHSGDRREVEIRCCSIWAVEALRRALARIAARNGELEAAPYPVLLDFFLYDWAKANAESVKHVPIHHPPLGRRVLHSAQHSSLFDGGMCTTLVFERV
eukprot:Rmarinus@m.3324